MSYLFYISYAREDNTDGLVSKFYEDLSKDIAGKIAARPDEVGFFDREMIEPGAMWDHKLVSALQQSAVFIAVYSPYYFQNKFCGREWAVFSSRIEAFVKSLLKSTYYPSLIFPVLWQNEHYVSPRMPTALREIQYKHMGFGKAYDEHGLRVILRNKKFRDEYEDFISVLADLVIDAAQRNKMPALPNLPPFEEIIPAFPVDDAQAAPAIKMEESGSPDIQNYDLSPTTQFVPLHDAYDRIVNFARHFGEPHIALAMHAALPIGLTPELVHLIRVNFVKRAPMIAEADLLLSPLCREVGGGLYEMYPEARELLLTELNEDEEIPDSQIKELAEFLMVYATRNLSSARFPELRNFLVAQQWTALARLRPAETAQSLASALGKRLSAQNPAGSLRLAQLTRSMSAQLTGQDNVLVYAAGVESLALGDAKRASETFSILGSLSQSPAVKSITLPAPADLEQLWPHKLTESGITKKSERKTANVIKKSRTGVFIAYSRSDGEAFASRLRQQLEKQNIRLWQDRVGMEGGRDWWLQITDALDNVKFMAMVVTPNALKSEIMRKEWRYARQQGVCVYPIKGVPDLDFRSLPRWMRDTHFYDLGSLEGERLDPVWQKFISDLNKTPDIRRVPFMVEDLDGFVPRPEEFDQLVALLLDQNREEPVAITAALRGAGGYGKTTLARAICHDERVQNAFDDGILWVTLGENPGDLTSRVEELIHQLSGDRPGFTNIEAAIARLKELLEDRDLLLVIDDLWNNAHLRPFMQGGPRCARLITTRNLDTLPNGIHKVKVDSMKQNEAVSLLSAGFEEYTDLPTVGNELNALADRLGEWPLLLKLVNGYLRKSAENENRTLPDAVVRANHALDRHGLTYFDDRYGDQRYDAVAKTIGISLDLLNQSEHDRYIELAVFPENIDIPIATVERLWRTTGGLDEFEADDLCVRLYRLSLLQQYDASNRTIRLHDAIRTYITEQHREKLLSLKNQISDTDYRISE
jgi:hypothetical protein